MKRYAIYWALDKWKSSTQKTKRNIFIGLGALFIVGLSVLILSIYLVFSLGGMALEKLTSLSAPASSSSTLQKEQAASSSNQRTEIAFTETQTDLLNRPIGEIVAVPQIQQGASVLQRIWGMAISCQNQLFNLLDPTVILGSSVADLWTKIASSCLTLPAGNNTCSGDNCKSQEKNADKPPEQWQ